MGCVFRNSAKRLPNASTVLTNYLEQSKEPPWTSFFVKYSSVIDDQRGRSHFNWKVGNSNYHVLRSGCFPYIKYHCTKRPYENLQVEDRLFYILKIINLGEQCHFKEHDYFNPLVTHCKNMRYLFVRFDPNTQAESSIMLVSS